jgi:hypothetical protein
VKTRVVIKRSDNYFYKQFYISKLLTPLDMSFFKLIPLLMIICNTSFITNNNSKTDHRITLASDTTKKSATGKKANKKFEGTPGKTKVSPPDTITHPKPHKKS